MEIGNKPKAYQCFERALSFDPDHWVRIFGCQLLDLLLKYNSVWTYNIMEKYMNNVIFMLWLKGSFCQGFNPWRVFV